MIPNFIFIVLAIPVLLADVIILREFFGWMSGKRTWRVWLTLILLCSVLGLGYATPGLIPTALCLLPLIRLFLIGKGKATPGFVSLLCTSVVLGFGILTTNAIAIYDLPDDYFYGL